MPYTFSTIEAEQEPKTPVYACAWHNNNPDHLYAPYAELKAQYKIINFYNDSYTIFAYEMPDFNTLPVTEIDEGHFFDTKKNF